MELIGDCILATPGTQALHVLKENGGVEGTVDPLRFPPLDLAHENGLELTGIGYEIVGTMG